MPRITPKKWLSDPENVDWLNRHAPPDLLGRLDVRTPMYLPLMLRLPKQQALIVAVAARMREFTAAELAREAGLKVGHCWSQLVRLEAAGWFERSSGRPCVWSFAELVDEVRVWILVRTRRRLPEDLRVALGLSVPER